MRHQTLSPASQGNLVQHQQSKLEFRTISNLLLIDIPG